MALAYNITIPILTSKPSNSIMKIKSTSNANQIKPQTVQIVAEKRCLRCNTLYQDKDNSPTACSFHGYTTGEKGLLALAPPHQGIDGEWSDRSGVIVYKWNDKINRPNTGSANWKKRWSYCAEYGENAPPCQRGWHVSYDDGHTLYWLCLESGIYHHLIELFNRRSSANITWMAISPSPTLCRSTSPIK